MVLRLATKDGRLVKPYLINQNSVNNLKPQEELDLYCSTCFKFRPQYLSAVDPNEPFDLDRASLIMNIMTEKGFADPKAFSLGNMLRRNLDRIKRTMLAMSK